MGGYKKMKKYSYTTDIKKLPKLYQNDIYNYIKDGQMMALDGAGISEEKITKKDLLNMSIMDIEEIYPVDTLIVELNK